MTQTIFISGIGTSIGKTVVSAIITEALGASYWKPIQAGFADGTDSELIRSLLSNGKSKVHPEAYKLRLAASPHLAAQNEGIEISIEKIFTAYMQLVAEKDYLIVEGPGGLSVPLNKNEFVTDLIKKLNGKLILVSRNYLGSINHSLLTAEACHQKNIKVLGWIFNDQYMDYEDDIVRWSGFPKIGSIARLDTIDKSIIRTQADKIKNKLLSTLQ